MSSTRIFVSHSHVDNDFCLKLVEGLTAAGAYVWYDEHDLGAVELTRTIMAELRQRPIFLLVLSPEALLSQWVENESLWAFTLYQRDRERSRVILPVLARDVRPEDLWLFLSEFKRIEGENCCALPRQEAIARALALLSLTTSGTSGGSARGASPGSFTEKPVKPLCLQAMRMEGLAWASSAA